MFVLVDIELSLATGIGMTLLSLPSLTLKSLSKFITFNYVELLLANIPYIFFGTNPFP